MSNYKISKYGITKFTVSGILHEETGHKKNRRFVYREYLNRFNR